MSLDYSAKFFEYFTNLYTLSLQHAMTLLLLIACCLHNMLRDAFMEESGQVFQEYDSKETPVNNIFPIPRAGGYANSEGFMVRDQFKEFFNNEGTVSWQENR
ncbi:protein ANTAGONIST OF LIKE HETEROCHROMATIN PROTEIN 1-like [Aphis craccivora]|uniref:Protein ANTAGONIST OF LIKE HETEROCHROMATIN PROTEIN 1-like n=1 Tax=Aphis craccivora TaxID=307492 RepID=A0A6G0VXA3_APHCR|nr:protein ANTAGONIST OF LIKE HETEROCHROMATIN PROTEIN 1-like [Aphis craccivora]